MTTQKDYIKEAYIVDDYHSIEEDFIKFIEYIPLFLYPKEEEMKKIISPKLADLLLRIGSKIDISFKSYLNLENGNWGDYKSKEDEKLKLSNNKIWSIHYNKYLTPFKDWQYINQKNELEQNGVSTPIDFWWNAYNNVKHHYQIENANLYHVYNSLSALFLLLCKFKIGQDYSIKLAQYNYLGIDTLGKEKILRNMREFHNPIITKLFLKNL